MKCSKCHVTISDVDKYCPRCGELFDNGDVERLTRSLENSLLNIYENKTFGNIRFSVGYLLFNFFYALYKKMYYEAIIGGFASGLFIYLILNWKRIVLGSLGFYALFVMFLLIISAYINIYYILNFDDMYIERAKSYINKIIIENGTKDIQLLNDLCKKDSRNNLVTALLPVILFIGIIAYLLFIY